MNEQGKPQGNNGPNAVQAEFIRLCAQKHYYLALGDTNHADFDIMAFSIHPQTLLALAGGGKQYLFLEKSSDKQGYLDDVMACGRSFNQSARKVGLALSGSRPDGSKWVAEEEMPRVGVAYKMAALTKADIKPVCANMRTENMEFSKVIVRGAIRLPQLLCWYGLDKMAERLPKTTGKAARNFADYILPYGLGGFMDAVLTNDKKLSSFIESFNRPAAIIYGFGHFNCIGKKCLGALLRQTEKSFCVLYVEKNADRAKARSDYIAQEYGCDPDIPGARLLVEPAEGNPHGIIITDPALVPLYQEALRNVAGRNPPGAVP